MAELSSSDHFQTILDFSFGIADRGIPLSIVFVEPDGWPAEGATAEQRDALEVWAAVVANRVRRSDRVTRMTDTCFAVLLMDCNRQGALIFADRIQMAAEDFSAASGCSVSCGIANFAGGMKETQDLLAAARKAVDVAHSNGGDRIEIFGDLPGS